MIGFFIKENMKNKYSFFIGRWQPLHSGHKAIIQKVLDEGKSVLIGIRDTEISDNNPYSTDDRKQMFIDYFGDQVDFIVIPDIAEVCYGRNVGYLVRELHMSKDIEEISGTKIRKVAKE